MRVFKMCLSYIMNFFNKYKDLFGVPSVTSVSNIEHSNPSTKTNS